MSRQYRTVHRALEKAAPVGSKGERLSLLSGWAAWATLACSSPESCKYHTTAVDSRRHRCVFGLGLEGQTDPKDGIELTTLSRLSVCASSNFLGRLLLVQPVSTARASRVESSSRLPTSMPKGAPQGCKLPCIVPRSLDLQSLVNSTRPISYSSWVPGLAGSYKVLVCMIGVLRRTRGTYRPQEGVDVVEYRLQFAVFGNRGRLEITRIRCSEGSLFSKVTR